MLSMGKQVYFIYSAFFQVHKTVQFKDMNFSYEARERLTLIFTTLEQNILKEISHNKKIIHVCADRWRSRFSKLDWLCLPDCYLNRASTRILYSQCRRTREFHQLVFRKQYSLSRFSFQIIIIRRQYHTCHFWVIISPQKC